MENIMTMKDQLLSHLNPSAFSTDSIEGWIIMALCLWIVYEVAHKAIDIVWWLVGALLIFQVGYWLSLTGLNNIVHLSEIFKYDLFMAVAQCFVGTKFCDVLLYIDSFLQTTFLSAWSMLSGTFHFS